MENNNNQPSRRKFVWGLGVLSLLTAAGSALKLPFLNKKAKATVKGKTIKMLTQDGKLVEVDVELITAARKKATNSDLQNWIKK